jgi:trimeric autotransporter adhesin
MKYYLLGMQTMYARPKTGRERKNKEIWIRMAVLIGLLLIFCKPSMADLPKGYITTVTGDTIQGYNGDGDDFDATKALVNLPMGVAVNPTGGKGGELFISDAGNHRIRKVDLFHGNIFTVAGNGSGDFRGDGELAINASIKNPAGITFGIDGSLFIADRGNHRIRKVDPNGLISTIAGGTKPGFRGDGGLSTQAALKDPMDVEVDEAGNVLIADFGNSRIRRVDARTGVISTIAGSGQRRYDGDNKPALEAGMNPSGLAFDGSGGLLIADMRNQRIRRIDLETGIIATIVGTGKRGFLGDGDLGVGAHLNNPSWVAVSERNDIYITDTGNNRVRKVDGLTGIITTVGGSGEAGYGGENGPAVEAHLWSPFGIAVDPDENIYIADYLNHRVRRINRRKAKPIIFNPPKSGGGWFKVFLVAVPSSVVITYLLITGREPDLQKPPGFPDPPDSSVR